MSVPKKLKSRNNNSRKTELFGIVRIHCVCDVWRLTYSGYGMLAIRKYILLHRRASAAHC